MDSNDGSFQIQTPPPTRDTAKRKPQQPQIRFATPSTIKSRRQSAPGESWLKSNIDHASLDSTPFQPSLQFSPPESLSFSSPGPTTAPAHPQMNIFWDGNTQSDFNFDSFQPSNADPSQSALNPFDFSPLQQKFRNNMPFSSPMKPVSTSSGSVSFVASKSNRHSISGASFVDPSMVWSENRRDNQGILISEPAARNPNTTPGQPYQFHVDELRREKEQQRLRRESTSRPRSSFHGADLGGSTRPSLQRSLTDSKSRKSFIAGQSGELGEITRGLAGTHILRHSSPVKRQRLSGSFQTSPNASVPTRKSVVLEVDENGRAKTIVKNVPDSSARQRTLLEDESDSDDGLAPPATSKRSSSTLSQNQEPSSASNAQDALRSMVQQRKQQRKPPIAADSCPLEIAAPIVTEGIGAPTSFTSAQDFNQITNCACGNNVPNALMIQW